MMTDKEFLELLMLYQAGKVPVVAVGLALAKNQFSHEYIALANNILVAQKGQNHSATSQVASYDLKDTIRKLWTEGVAVEAIAKQVQCSLTTVNQALEN